MSRRLEQTLMTWMRRQAAEASRGSDPEGLTYGAIDRARRIRRRRSVVSGAVAVVVLVSAVPTGAAALDWFRDAQQPDVRAMTSTPDPTTTPSRRERPEEPKGLARVTLDFGELPAGDTDVPWWEAASETVHAGGSTLPMTTPWSFAQVADDGYALLTTPDGGWRLEIVRQSGSRLLAEAAPEDQLSKPVIRADGERLAWAESSPGDGTTLHVATAEGEEVASTHLAGREDTSVEGFLGERVLVSSPDEDEVQVWDPSSNRLTELPGGADAVRAWASASATGVTSVATELVEEEGVMPHWCNAVLDTNAAEALWESCELTPVGFSPDGRYAVTQPSDTEGAGPLAYTVVSAETGRPVLELRADVLSRFTWEDDGQYLVVQASVDGEEALVRCGLDGTCELVAEPLPSDFPADPETYVLSYR